MGRLAQGHTAQTGRVRPQGPSQSDSKASVLSRECLRAGAVRGRKAPLHPSPHHPGNRLPPGLQAACFQSAEQLEGGPPAGVQGRARRCRRASPGVCSPAGLRSSSDQGRPDGAETCVCRPPLSLSLQPHASPDSWNPPSRSGLCRAGLSVQSAAIFSTQRRPPAGGPPSSHHRGDSFSS